MKKVLFVWLCLLYAWLPFRPVDLCAQGPKGGGGGGSTTLTNPAFLFQDGVDGGLFLLSYNGATRKRLTSPTTSGAKDSLAAWSPDLNPNVAGYQGQIAFFRPFDPRYIWGEIMLVPADGSAAPISLCAFTDFTIPPPTNANQNYAMSWSPDGSHLVYAAEGSIWAVHVGTATVFQLFALPRDPVYAALFHPCLSRDRDLQTPGYQGQLVCSVNGNGPPGGNGSDIALIHVQTETAGRLVTVGDWYPLTTTTDVAEMEPVWSPDGTRIAWFTIPAFEEPFGTGRRLGVFEPSTGISWTVASVVKYAVRPSWSPDGLEIGYSADRAVGNKTTFDVFRVNSAGGVAPVNVSRTDSNRSLENNAIWCPGWTR